MAKGFPAMAEVHTVVFDFDGIFTDNKVWVDESGRESVSCDRRDGLGLDLVRTVQRRGKISAELFILSREPNPVVLARARKLKLTCHHAIVDKLAFMQEHLASRFPSRPDSWGGVVYMGNDLNDLALVRRVGFSIAPGDAHPRVRAAAHLVLEEPGGAGCVRAFIERWLAINKLTDEEIDELVSDR